MSRTPSMDDLTDVTSASEFQRMCNSGRLIHVGLADVIAYTAAELRASLKKAHNGNPWLMGVDSGQAAWAVTRHLFKAAGHDWRAAQEFTRGWVKYQELFQNAQRAAAPRRRTFDMAR